MAYTLRFRAVDAMAKATRKRLFIAFVKTGKELLSLIPALIVQDQARQPAALKTPSSGIAHCWSLFPSKVIVFLKIVACTVQTAGDSRGEEATRLRKETAV